MQKTPCAGGGQRSTLQYVAMENEKILVPLGVHARNLGCVHYALSLAVRIKARIYVIRQRDPDESELYGSDFLDQALYEMIDNARQNGISLTLNLADGNLVDDIVALVNAEHIGLLIFGADDEISETVMPRVKTLVSSQIIEVKEKEYKSSSEEDEKRYGTRNDL
jgi:hypothetical protein